MTTIQKLPHINNNKGSLEFLPRTLNVHNMVGVHLDPLYCHACNGTGGGVKSDLCPTCAGTGWNPDMVNAQKFYTDLNDLKQAIAEGSFKVITTWIPAGKEVLGLIVVPSNGGPPISINIAQYVIDPRNEDSQEEAA